METVPIHFRAGRRNACREAGNKIRIRMRHIIFGGNIMGVRGLVFTQIQGATFDR